MKTIHAQTLFFGFGSLALVLAGCSTEIITTDQNSGATSGSGAGGAGGNGSGSGGCCSESATTGPNPDPPCTLTDEPFDVTVVTSDGANWGCGFGFDSQQGDLIFDGQVLSGAGGDYTIDTCSPAADCLPQLTKVIASSPELTFALPAGAFVRVHVHVEIPMGCAHRLSIENLPEWDGVPNPVLPGVQKLWLEGSDGLPSAFEEDPFVVETILANCSTGNDTVAYDLQFRHDTQDDSGVALPMGKTGEWVTPAGAWFVRNLKSYDPKVPDDNWHWGYWIAAGAGGG